MNNQASTFSSFSYEIHQGRAFNDSFLNMLQICKKIAGVIRDDFFQIFFVLRKLNASDDSGFMLLPSQIETIWL